MKSLLKVSAPALFTILLPLATACSSDARQDASQVRNLEEFDPNDFNAGMAFEFLVNPAYTRTGEHDAEAVEPVRAPWLASVDAFAEEREWRNLVAYQKSTVDGNADDIAAHNLALKAVLSAAPAGESGFSLAEAKQLYKKLVSQPQVTSHGTFDPEYSIGFCFGRAMIVHAFAKNAFVRDGDTTRSLKDVPVRKIWVTGPMGQWKHHVATMVLAKEADVGFWVIDNFVGSVKSATDWMTQISATYPTVKVMYNVTRANRFSEANSLRYYQVLLDDPFFNGFFREFLVTNVPPINANGGIDFTPPSTPTSPSSPVVEGSFGGSTPTPLNVP